MKWESIDSKGEESRAKVPGGWVLKIYENVYHINNSPHKVGYDWRVAITFIPDPNHEWTL